ncbi:MAG: outer membrane lipoprotein LolB [Neisseria sp.]|nr:outer membrane lipoprotein LolB [Neisseria sp.]
MSMRRMVCTLAVLFLSACAGIGTPMSPDAWQPASPTLPTFHASGRLAVKSDLNKGSYAGFDWERGNSSQTVSVNTPLGNTVGQLCRDAHGVVAQNARGERFQAADSETLSLQLTGFAVPLDYLDMWTLGFYHPQDPHRIAPDGSLQQAGWVIRRELNSEMSTPRNLSLSRDGLSIRMVFDDFTLHTPDTAAVCPQR